MMVPLGVTLHGIEIARLTFKTFYIQKKKKRGGTLTGVTHVVRQADDVEPVQSNISHDFLKET